MTKRQLVAFEADPAAPGGGRLFGLDPNTATGVPIPAFRTGGALPAAGQVAGEAFLNTASKTAFVWDGNKWEPIVPSAILSYATDTAVLADTAQPAGSYGAASDSGNLYVMSATGWRQVGTRTYPALATLLAAQAGDGQDAVALDVGVAFARVGGKWRAMSPYVATEAQITANTTLPDGTTAVATDTGHTFTRTGGQWIGSPVMNFATEALLLAATPPAGVMAFAQDTGLVYGRTAAGWRRVNAPTSMVNATAPATPAVGDVWTPPAGGSKVWDGTKWVDMSTRLVGEIKMWPKIAPPPHHLLCDGSNIPAQYADLIALIGPKLPDLRGQFIRGATSDPNFDKKQWTTGGPRNPFTTDTQGNHHHTSWFRDGGVGNGPYNGTGSGGWFGWQTRDTSDAGNHSHRIAGGGDSETAPDHVYLAFVICAE